MMKCFKKKKSLKAPNSPLLSLRTVQLMFTLQLIWFLRVAKQVIMTTWNSQDVLTRRQRNYYGSCNWKQNGEPKGIMFSLHLWFTPHCQLNLGSCSLFFSDPPSPSFLHLFYFSAYWVFFLLLPPAPHGFIVDATSTRPLIEEAIA